MITLQPYRWISAWPWTFLFVAVMAVSGCVTIEGYKKDKVEYDRQNAQSIALVRRYAEEINNLNARQVAYKKTLADEARLKEENSRLRQRIATAEKESKGRTAAQQTPSGSAFKELGKTVSAQTYELVLEELGYYSNLENLYNRQLNALSLHHNGLPYIRRTEFIRAQALLDVISEAIVTVNIPREPLRESTQTDDPRFEQALKTLADAQDQMLIALNDFKLGGRDQSNRKYPIAQSTCVNMLAAIRNLTAGEGDGSPLAKDLSMRLKAMHTIIEVANILLTTTNTLMDSSTQLTGQQVVGQSLKLKDYQPIAQQLSYLVPRWLNVSTVETGQPKNSAIRFLNRMESIMTMATYCQGNAFKPETYLQMRLAEIRPLKAAVLEVIESYKLAHARP